jgi:hypothetical protein
MGIKSKEYKEYEKKVADYRRTKLELWKLSERSENDYKQIALLTPYNEADFKENFPNINLICEQAFYFTTRYHFKLVADFIETIENLDSKLLFLIEIKADFEHDIKGIYTVRVTPNHYGARDVFNFGEFCQIEINKIKELLELAQRKNENSQVATKPDSEFIREWTLRQARQPFMPAESDYWKPIKFGSGEDISPNEQSTRESKSFTLRQKVLALMLLTFQRLDLPEDITKERVIEFFHGITGGSRKNLGDWLANPTAHEDTVKSIKSLSDDLNFVRDHLGKLGLSENIKVAKNEINFLIEDLKDKANEQ